MKKSEISAGGIYTDGKHGIREIIALNDNSTTVHYRLLAAKKAQEWSYSKDEMVSQIGEEFSCKIDSFANWAKKQLPPEAAKHMLLELRAAKIKLPPGEASFMRLAKEESGGKITAGTEIQVAPSESRAASGLEKKGLLVRSTGEATFTNLGEAWFSINEKPE